MSDNIERRDADSRIWVLPRASDPEMVAIEALLRECGETVVYALDERGERVTAATAYRCPVPDAPEGATVYAVECIDALPDGWVRIDHHRPGDPGYGRPPSEFLAASSVGQVIAELARLDLWPSPGDGGRYWTPTNCRPMWVGTSYEDPHGVGGWWIVGDDSGGCCHRLPYALVPRDLVLIAAADHCLGAAYRGECPGVDPDALMRWRAESRAKFQGRSVEEVLADVERAQAALRAAPSMYLEPPYDIDRFGQPSDWSGYPAVGSEGGVEVRDMRQPVNQRPTRELPEAAARLGIGYVSGPLVGPDGRQKITCSGTADQVRAFLDHWAPSQGLVDAYGDPQRGFAGAYMTTEAQ